MLCDKISQNIYYLIKDKEKDSDMKYNSICKKMKKKKKGHEHLFSSRKDYYQLLFIFYHFLPLKQFFAYNFNKIAIISYATSLSFFSAIIMASQMVSAIFHVIKLIIIVSKKRLLLNLNF